VEQKTTNGLFATLSIAYMAINAKSRPVDPVGFNLYQPHHLVSQAWNIRSPVIVASIAGDHSFIKRKGFRFREILNIPLADMGRMIVALEAE